MADNLTDEERAALILGDVEPEKAAEPPKETTDLEPEEEELANESEQQEESTEEEKPTEEETPAFTKQFPNLKGETLEEYKQNIEEAYDNSFKEALRLIEENKQLKAQLAQTPVTAPTEPAAPAAPVVQSQPIQAAINEMPEIQRIKAQDTQSMFGAFDEFKKQYPQATEQTEFDKFTKVSNGVNQTLTDELGRIPTWSELYNGIARILAWQPVNPSKDAAIKNAGASSHTNSTTLAPAKRSKVSDAQVDAYLKMFTSKTREDAVKELSEVV